MNVRAVSSPKPPNAVYHGTLANLLKVVQDLTNKCEMLEARFNVPNDSPSSMEASFQRMSNNLEGKTSHMR
jgi:chaperonin cofactor prefoldin